MNCRYQPRDRHSRIASVPIDAKTSARPEVRRKRRGQDRQGGLLERPAQLSVRCLLGRGQGRWVQRPGRTDIPRTGAQAATMDKPRICGPFIESVALIFGRQIERTCTTGASDTRSSMAASALGRTIDSVVTTRNGPAAQVRKV